MRLWLVGLTLGLLATWVSARLAARQRRRVTRDWLVDHERRAWGRGVDQVGVASWPIQKDDE